MKRLALAAAIALVLAGHARAAEEAPHPPAQDWSFFGVFGTFDRAQLQRGFHIYQDVCSGCHGLYHVSYRDLGPAGPMGGLGFTGEEATATAAQRQVTDGPNDQGEMFERPARPSDKFVRPFANENAARFANNGAYPPDLSLVTKAREGGPDYVYALLTGYEEPPADFQLQDGMSYNRFFPGHQIAMPPPLAEGVITYADGTEATIEQMARDVTAFLHWAAEPNLDERHQTGLKAMLFLVIATLLFYAVKRRVWAALH
jgi:ubiquinol-cytochrome c reductase cytochrome c1 subunit